MIFKKYCWRFRLYLNGIPKMGMLKIIIQVKLLDEKCIDNFLDIIKD